MAPKANQAAPKNQGRGKGKPDPATQISKIEYGLPKTVVGITLQAAGSYTGEDVAVLPLGWADDLAIIADVDSPGQLQHLLPRFTSITLATRETLRFRINLGVSKTELMLEVRGAEAKRVRGELLTSPSLLRLASGHEVRISPEYRYLGVISTPRDTGRRDMELCAQRAHAAWSHAKSLMACFS